MKALGSAAVALTFVVGFLIHRGLSKEDAPSRDFVDLELSVPGESGSCYSLSTVLIANGIYGRAPRTWTRTDDGAWQLTVESVESGYAGPTRQFSTWTFERHGKAVELVKVAASEGRPQDPVASLTDLLDAPNANRSTPVDRCRAPGAQGFLYPPK